MAILEPAVPEGDPWQGPSLYAFLRQCALEAFPGDLAAAFSELCRSARGVVAQRRFRTWSTDFRREQDGAVIWALAQIRNPEQFLREQMEAAPPAMTTPMPRAELVDA
jgi:hypothetical protein